MIAKHIPVRPGRKSCFLSLVRYITNGQGMADRTGMVRIRNCAAGTVQGAVPEVLAIQQRNVRAKADRTYHLLVSFRAGEVPPDSVLEAVEERICAGIGFGGHQRISAVHHDTDNLHIHIAINKVHPETLNLKEPYRAYGKIAELCSVLEEEYGLSRDNHQVRRSVPEGRALDMERRTGLESLVTRVRRTCMEEMRGAGSWKDLHAVMEKNGLRLKLRGSGLVIVDGDGSRVRASMVARDLSKARLEASLGPFQEGSISVPEAGAPGRPAGFGEGVQGLFSRYLEEQKVLSAGRERIRAGLQRNKDRRIAAVLRSGRRRYALIRLSSGPRSWKKLLRNFIYKETKRKIAEIRDSYGRSRNRYRRKGFTEWLKDKALSGEEEALSALRSCRKEKPFYKENTVSGPGSGGRGMVPEKVTGKGTLIYPGCIRDDGERIIVPRQAAEQIVKDALLLAVSRYGSRLHLDGSSRFKAQVIRAASQACLPVTFSGPRPVSGDKNTRKDDHDRRRRNERCGPDRCGDGRSSGRSGYDRRAGAGLFSCPVRRIRKPRPGFDERRGECGTGYRLRTLSELNVACFGSGNEMLLSNYASGKLEHKDAGEDRAMRRGIQGKRGIKKRPSHTGVR